MTELPAGWGFPLDARKAHYFLVDRDTSLCGRWLYTGPRQDDNHESRDNCIECKVRRLRHLRGTG